MRIIGPHRILHHRRARAGVTIAAALALGSGMLAVASTQARAAAGCQVNYSVVTQWDVGFTGDIVITNLGAPLTGWTLEWDYSGNQQVTQSWNSTSAQTGTHVTLTNASFNASVGTNGTVNPGFNASYSGTNAAPTSFSLNGVTCTGVAPPPSSSPPPPPPSSTSPPPPPPTSTQPPGPPNVTHVDNPFTGAIGYLNPDYQNEVATNAPSTGTLGAAAREVANIPSAVWLDSMSAVTGTTTRQSLAAHLDDALAQEAAAGQQLVATFVIYDLPNRDCAAFASNGELRISQDGLNIYKTQYIDPIAAIMSDPKYQDVRIATVVEPDSLPNLVTNLSIADCAEANSTGAYRLGIQYALDQLHAIPNVYTYIDLGHYAWLGWDSNFNPAVNLITGVIKGTTAGVNSVDGFISDTAGYSTTTEPFMTANQTVNGQPVRSAHFYQFNTYIDEASYDTAMYNAFVAQGFPASIGMLIDTSRNGWGGAARPSGPSTSTTLDTFVNDSRIDRRPHSGGWCNQSGAGIGTRPVASPMAHFDAFVWIKPPGESDGVADPTAPRFDAMCDPNAQNRYDNSVKTNALPGAPQAGQWFEAEFEMLLRNALPAL